VRHSRVLLAVEHRLSLSRGDPVLMLGATG
jgi:hypothetical protein